MIKELKAKITDIENNVNEAMTKEELYDLLVVAYHHAKDIIAIQEASIESVPILEAKVESLAAKNAETLRVLKASLLDLAQTIENVNTFLDK